MPEESRWRRGFWSLIATQFQGAFNENGLKYFVIYLVLGMNLSKTNEDRKVLLVGALFSLPFIFFSLSGGYLADRFSKRNVTIWVKYFEIALMLLATAAFAWHSLNLALLCVFLASTQGALFGPSKYGLLPELLPEKLLSWGNGVLELGTFLAIIAGAVAGAFMADFFRAKQEIPGLIFFGCSMLGLAASYAISRVPAADAGKKFRVNFLGDLLAQGKLIRRDRALWLAVLGNTYFWFFGALLQFDIIFYGKYVLRTSGKSLVVRRNFCGVGSLLHPDGFSTSGTVGDFFLGRDRDALCRLVSPISAPRFFAAALAVVSDAHDLPD